jgi:hypothetical protein
MTEINKTYRIRTDVGNKSGSDYITLDANLVQDYDVFDILSVKIDSVDTYKLHNANYGVVVGRVLANNGFGVPNAKISIFIPSDGEDGEKVKELYPFSNPSSKDRKGVRYNLLPDDKVNDCHQVVGTFPNKRYALDNDVILEVFEKYYKYTVRTNNAGDYLIMGVPLVTHTLHMDLDLSDCGILSQRPRDFVYKGYTVEQFENPNMFKNGTNYGNLSQIFTQDQVVNVQPFWGNSSLGEKIGITRADINIAFKFEPTCVFMGSVISDNSSQGISKKCRATEGMGNMEELTTGEGTIEMIRKTPSGDVEEFQVKGTQLIDGNGVWCYQIPMNLDYMMTDEYGNMVPTDNPDKGIPTRTRVRFRVSMGDNEKNVDNYFRAKVLVPHNPQNLSDGKYEDYDYEFGTYTREDSYRDLFWNNVYSVKSYIPRFQKRKVGGWKDKKFTGIKNCNFFGSNNPMPYNNIRIKLPFMFTVMCAIIKIFIFVVSIINTLISLVGNFLSDLGDTFIGFKIWKWRVGFYPFKGLYKKSLDLSMNVLKEGLCPDLENWFFAPMFKANLWVPSSQPPKDYPKYDLLKQTLNKIRESNADDDKTSIDIQNNEEKEGEEPICLTIHTDYLISCVEMNLAMEYRVINFDFYNDWVNGTLYFPRFMRYVRPKRTFLGITFVRSKVRGCMDDTKIFSKTRRYTQQCSIGYKAKNVSGRMLYTNVDNPVKSKKPKNIKAANNLHKQRGLSQKSIFGSNGGICHEHTTLKGQYVYYMKPCEWTKGTTPANRKVNLYATDIILLGSLSDCDLNGIPQAFKYLSSTSYVMPTNLALTNMESNGYLYATGKGTICTGTASLSESDVKNDEKVNVIPPSCGLTAEILAFSGAQDSNYDVQYDGKELSDIIALTEAAGISWNYTGPGQGEEVVDEMYHPGGHFLGLSCVNSRTNIKSCINLSRICEVGANMSQRKEDITSIDDSGNVHYSYTAPSGFISGDDIVGEDFRSMFATMNYKRLLATRTNPNTGYKMYDMEFVKPINFDGAFNSVVTAGSGLYNREIEVPVEKDSVFENAGISISTDDREDYDPEEIDRTQIRTIEDTSLDYYLFRFGLSYEDLTKTNQKHLRRFLLTDGGHLYLPQYENSYYFYFGLKNGATALDEFNKQFYSECANGILLGGEPTVNIFIDDDIDMCVAKADITITTTNLETPFQYVEILSDVNFIKNNEGEPVKGILVKNGDDEQTYDSWLSSYSFELSGCPFGTYRVTVRDANDVVYTKTQKIGADVIGYDSEVYHFNSSKKRDTSGDTIHKGGYITVSNLKIDRLSEDTDLTVFVVDTNDSECDECIFENDSIYNECVSKIASKTIKNGEEEPFNLTVNNVGEYKLMVAYKCGNNNRVGFLLQTFTVKDTSSLKLYIGSPGLYSKEMTAENYDNEWWKNMGDDKWWLERVATFNEVEEVKRAQNSSAIKTYAVGGTKIVWGSPQKGGKDEDSGIEIGTIKSSEDNDISAGFTVDDEYLHWPTLKYKGNEAPNFSATVYDNDMVMGDYVAYIKDGGFNWVDKNKTIPSGCGYVFKPVPNGDLQFHVYYKGDELAYDLKDDENNDIKNGVFYPSIHYHSVDREFKVEAKFYCWENRVIEMITDEMGEAEPTVMDYEEGGKTEMIIHNGITYDDKFFSGTTNSGGTTIIESSYITNYDGVISAPYHDFYGVYEGKNRLTVINCYNSECKSGENNVLVSGKRDITTYGYNIIEGIPYKNEDGESLENSEIENNLQMVNSISDVVDSSFADYITFTIETDENGTPRIIGPNPEGGPSGSKAVYYLAKNNKNSTGLLLSSATTKYIYAMASNTFFVFATYTDKATFNTEGSPVLVKITWSIFNAVFSFPLKNESGDTETFTGRVSVNYGDIPGLFNAVFNAQNNGYVNGVYDNKIIMKDNWEELLLKHTLVDEGDDTYISGDTYYAYGVIYGENGTKLYKIYPTVVKVSEFKDEDITQLKIKYNDQDGTEIKIENVDSGGDVLDVTIIKSANKSWTAEIIYNDEKNKGWCEIEPNNSTMNLIKIGVAENSGEAKRDCTISIDCNGEKAAIKITQNGTPKE